MVSNQPVPGAVMTVYQGTSFTPELTPAGYALFRAGVKVSAGTCDDLAGSLRRRHQRNGTRWRLLDPLAQPVLVIAFLRTNLTYAELAAGSVVSSKCTTYDKMISILVRVWNPSSRAAARASMPCTNPGDTLAPVRSAMTWQVRSTGIAWTTSRYTARVCRFGPIETGASATPAGSSARVTCPHPHRSECSWYSVTVAVTRGTSICWRASIPAASCTSGSRPAWQTPHRFG